VLCSSSSKHAAVVIASSRLGGRRGPPVAASAPASVSILRRTAMNVLGPAAATAIALLVAGTPAVPTAPPPRGGSSSPALGSKRARAAGPRPRQSTRQRMRRAARAAYGSAYSSWILPCTGDRDGSHSSAHLPDSYKRPSGMSSTSPPSGERRSEVRASSFHPAAPDRTIGSRKTCGPKRFEAREDLHASRRFLVLAIRLPRILLKSLAGPSSRSSRLHAATRSLCVDDRVASSGHSLRWAEDPPDRSVLALASASPSGDCDEWRRGRRS
jgi:hypothetical protein